MRQMLHALSNVPFLQGLGADKLGLLEPLLEPYTCPSGTVIFEQGQPAHHLYLALRGAVEIRYKPYDGPALTVTRVGAGDVFGWSAVIGSAAYTSAAVCLKDLEAVRMRGSDLRALCTHEPETGKIILDRLARVVSSRWQDAHAQVHSLLARGVLAERGLRSLRKRGARAMANAGNHTVEERLKTLIEQLSAYVEQFHGGSVEFVSFDGKMLRVRLGGACLGCPLSPATLHGWVAGTVRQFFPEIEVLAAE